MITIGALTCKRRCRWRSGSCVFNSSGSYVMGSTPALCCCHFAALGGQLPLKASWVREVPLACISYGSSGLAPHILQVFPTHAAGIACPHGR
jgi:hypothetical protein